MQKEPGSTEDIESSSHPGAGGGFFTDGSPLQDIALLGAPALLTALVFLLLPPCSLVTGRLHFLWSAAPVFVFLLGSLVQVQYNGSLILSLILSHFEKSFC